MKKMIDKAKLSLMIATTGMAVLCGLASPSLVYGADCTKTPKAENCPCAVNPSSAACKDIVLKNGNELTSSVQGYINTAFFWIGLLAVAMIVYSGISFMTAHGDKSRVQNAKNILIYSIVGLAVAMLSYAITSFVLSIFK